MESVWALPGGTPGVIYLDASGNDMYVNEDEMKATEQTQDRQTRVIQQLQRMYPSSKIVLGGVVSMSESAAPDPQKLTSVTRPTRRPRSWPSIPACSSWTPRTG